MPEAIGIERVGEDRFAAGKQRQQGNHQPQTALRLGIIHASIVGNAWPSLESATMSDVAANPQPAKTRVFLRLLHLLRPQWGMIGIGLLLLLLSMPAELFPAFVWMYVVDYLVREAPTRSSELVHELFSFHGQITQKHHLLISSLVWLFGVYAIGEAFGTISNNLMNRVAQKFILEFRNRVYHKLQSQSLAYLQRQRTGDLMSRAMGDVDELQTFIVNGIDVIIGEGLLWFVTVIIVLLLDWKVALASLSPLIVVYVMLQVFNKRIAPVYKAARERAGDVSTRLEENLNGVTVIKIFNREPQEAGRFRAATEAYYDQQIKAVNARSLYFPFSRAVGFLSNVFMIGVGGYSILTGGGFTVGKLLAFRAYWWRLFGPIQTLARVNDMVQRSIAAGRRVFEVLDSPDELPDALDSMNLDRVSGGMALEHVSFSYLTDPANSAPPMVLKDVSIRVEPGQTVALCGPSGSGKSTVLSLLLRFYDATSGQVTIDGIDVKRIRRESLRSRFALVQQETFLFNDSILDNIRYGHAEATMDQVIAATRAANAHDFIERLPQGYDTKVGERGVRLSGGQKQRISIARAFLANPQVLLLDEPTSSVEPDSEAAIIAALDRLMAGRTTVVTSHRPSLIGQADVVYVIEDGKVVDSGSPSEVRSRNAWFARFMQTSDPTMAIEQQD
jgi:ABC-type multidrug transport system fused ATPase/permease subunit